MKNKEKGLYVPELEHDSCGIGFVAHLKGKKSHDLVEDALTMLENMEHRGACGCEPDTGDGAGILMQMPHEFFVKEAKKLHFELPEYGNYGVGVVFFPRDERLRNDCRTLLNINIRKLGFELLGYRKVPTNNEGVGASAVVKEPVIEQVIVKHKRIVNDPDTLERKLYVLRRYTTHTISRTIPGAREDFYLPTFSYKLLAYKGQLTTYQLSGYFPDLHDERMTAAIALIHSRFSTNTFPKWRLAQPFRYIAHNGEINTIKGNVNWMRSNETILESTLFTREEIQMLIPICEADHSDSANLDAMIELLVMGGRSLPHTMMMLIPEAWQENDLMPTWKKEFYQYHATLIEPWDGPASICFTDGKIVGATLDRNGLRPSRYCLTDDNLLIMSSEAGALPVNQSKVVLKGRLQPGKMFIADLEQGRIISDEEIKKDICTRRPYGEWIEYNETHIDSLPEPEEPVKEPEEGKLFAKQYAFGFTDEDLRTILKPMAEEGKEPIGSMGTDSPPAVLSQQSQHLSNYFKQLFAQVSNPPIDSIRERLVMSLFTSVGRTWNILSETPLHCKAIYLPQPVLTNQDLEKIRQVKHTNFRSKTIDAVFEVNGDHESLEKAIDKICIDADKAILDQGNNILIISDRAVDVKHAPIPSLLAVGAIHHHLIRNGRRVRAGLVVESGDARETHHFATLIGYGANAVNPYMAFDTITNMVRKGKMEKEISVETAHKNYIKAIGEGLLKIFSKMGISTLQSYHGAQIFEAVGLSSELVDKCFAGTVSRLEGISFEGIARESLIRHRIAFTEKPLPKLRLEVGGVHQWKRRGEFHALNPETIALLQKSTRLNDYSLFKEYTSKVNDQTEKAFTLRGLLEFRKRSPVPIDEVEPKENIFKRFATGAMSFGSISFEAHTTLAIAMNRIGGKSNSGEGGEDEIRYKKLPNGDWQRSAIKQVASGRFGVTSYYLTNANELQIKMSQGAKPGEGGQLPGHKVDEWIGRVRHSTPGVGLISPPPHHDIYSIEDLAQLIFDLKNANRHARINVKLVSEAGVGTIAAGVAKGHADVILISGHDGGTGASPISSIHHAGTPWELGLSEAHQTLVRNNLRSRVTLQTDGKLLTGRDLAIAILLGAEEWGIATAALIVEGCIMMRKCHLNTCPVGVATQDKRLRDHFMGKPEYVVNFFNFLAEELREVMAELGFRTVNEMVGQVDALKQKEDVSHWKINQLDLSPILYKEPVSPEVGLYKQMEQDHGLERALDWKLMEVAGPAFETGEIIYAEFPVRNTDRAVGTMLSNEISKKFEKEGLPDNTINFKFRGSAGQSFGAFGAPGLKLELEGEANDYFGKGLSGARLVTYPDRTAGFRPEENIIIGNVAFYGATSGEAYIRGQAGERFCVRNSGVKAVVEGVGDHGCEYMTGGIAVILGATGRNFAAGMSGGIAYVYDRMNSFHQLCNMEMVDFDTLEYDDMETLRRMIENHYQFTGSDVAGAILDNWSESLSRFVKVMPREYKAALIRRHVSLKEAI